MRLPFEYVIGIKNCYNKIVKEEEEARKKAEAKQKDEYNVPSMSSMMSSANNMMRGSAPKMPSLPH